MPNSLIPLWILGALRGRSSTLREIIARADYLNHAILTYEEFNNAADMLRSRGLARRSAMRFELCGVDDSLSDEDLLRQIANTPASDSEAPPMFSRAEFQKAVSEYLER
ncbi:MAG: hypothetical protein K1X75_13215 [Leptospirales bacterium]|nr:hypothetical protein [Leptospirales bacterium]